MNAITTQPAQPNLPQIAPSLPIDPSNPLAWIIVLTTLLSATAKPLNATAKVITAIVALIRVINNKKRAKK
jgi:hypothetical protein